MVVGWVGFALVSIVGGQAAAVCEFPTAASVGGCSGSLIHPEIVMYAAHCGSPGQIGFGETRAALARTVAVDHCGLAKMDGEGPSDYAYCRLAEPVLDVPITPILFGCELAELVNGREAWIAGWGQTGDGGAGTKHWAATQIDMLFEYWVHVGEAGIGTASGDSGSGAYLRLDDGGWRAVGAASTGGQPGNYVRMDLVVDWIEERSGVDITPCMDADGTWNPTVDCGGFSADPLAGGDWASGCSLGGVSGPADSCGPAFGEPPPDPPAVAITTPTEDQSHPDDSVELSVEFTVTHPWPVRRAWLEIDGEVLPELDAAPFGYADLVFVAGEYSLVAWAEDWSGIVGQSDPITVAVGVEEDPAGSSSDGDSSGTMGTDPVDSTSTTVAEPEPQPEPEPTTTDEPASGGEDAGCGCAAGGRSPPPFLLLLVAAARRRRGERR